MAIFEDYISLKDAASNSGYHSDYIGALVRSGKIKGKKMGNRWVVSAEAVNVYFYKKHYAPAARVFLSKRMIISGVLVAAIVLSVSAYLIDLNAKPSQAAAASVNSVLSEITNGLSTDSSASSTGSDDAAPIDTPTSQLIVQQP